MKTFDTPATQDIPVLALQHRCADGVLEWVIPRCPFCEQQHVHGSPEDDRAAATAVRVPHCGILLPPRGDYQLVRHGRASFNDTIRAALARAAGRCECRVPCRPCCCGGAGSRRLSVLLLPSPYTCELAFCEPVTHFRVFCFACRLAFEQPREAAVLVKVGQHPCKCAFSGPFGRRRVREKPGNCFRGSPGLRHWPPAAECKLYQTLCGTGAPVE